MKGGLVAALFIVVAWLVVPAAAVQKPSDSFPYKYEGSVLPSAASPAYSYASGSSLAETDYASILSGGVLWLNTDTISGVPPHGTSLSGWYTLNGGSGTAWNPAAAGPFTIEVRMKSLVNNSGSYNAWFDWHDENSDILLQVWFNKVSLNGVEVTGLDNQTAFHTYRIVSAAYGASADQKFDLYRDGVLIISGSPNVADYPGSSFKFGDMTGMPESNVQVDYIRWDDSNAWEPVPPGDSAGYPYRYEADALPSAATPAYTYASGSSLAETDYASILSGGVLWLNTDTISGVPPHGTSLSGWYTLTGGSGTVWNPGPAGPFTIEVKMKSLPNNGQAYNAWFDWHDENSDILLQVWFNKVYLNGVEVTGLDNQSVFHVYRIVSAQYGASADQKFDLYRDGIQIITQAPNWVDYTGSLFRFGDMTGYYESNVQVDYIRWDDANAWRPPSCGVQGYLKGDLNKDCAVDMKDVAVMAQGWLFSTNPNNSVYVDCSDPANSGICK